MDLNVYSKIQKDMQIMYEKGGVDCFYKLKYTIL